MTLRPSLWLFPFLLIASVAGGSAQVAEQDAVTADTVVATVNGVNITAGHLLMLRAQLPQQFQTLPDEQLYPGLVDQAVQQELLASTVSELDRTSRLALENQTRNMQANIAAQRVFEAGITEEAIQTAYEARYAGAEPGTEYNASHILVDSEEIANEVIAAIEAGADFADMARERSTGPSGPSGGNLGWFGAGMMVPEFETAVIALEPGAMSGPVQTQFGWHVVMLNETRITDAPPLDEVRRDLVTELQTKVLADHLEDLNADAEVSVTDAGDIAVNFLSNPMLLQD
jgi:peptidyl-prolyl cis-trans isomerase C